MEDELHPLRERFALSCFPAVLEKLQQISQALNDISLSEKKGIEARCYLATGKYSMLKELKDSPDPGPRSVAMTAMYMKAKDPSHKQKAYEGLLELAKTTKDPVATYMCACVLGGKFNETGDSFQLIEGIHLLNGLSGQQNHTGQPSPGLSAESLGLLGQLLLLLNQHNLAIQCMRACNSIADDHAVAKVLSALVNLSASNSNLGAVNNAQEAFLLFCDLEALYGDELHQHPSLSVLNGKGCANLLRGNWSEAAEDLEKSFTVGPNDADTLLNLCALSVHTRKDEDLEKYLGHLSKYCGDHQVMRKLGHLETSFKNFTV